MKLKIDKLEYLVATGKIRTAGAEEEYGYQSLGTDEDTLINLEMDLQLVTYVPVLQKMDYSDTYIPILYDENEGIDY